MHTDLSLSLSLTHSLSLSLSHTHARTHARAHTHTHTHTHTQAQYTSLVQMHTVQNKINKMQEVKIQCNTQCTVHLYKDHLHVYLQAASTSDTNRQCNAMFMIAHYLLITYVHVHYATCCGHSNVTYTADAHTHTHTHINSKWFTAIRHKVQSYHKPQKKNTMNTYVHLIITHTYISK